MEIHDSRIDLSNVEHFRNPFPYFMGPSALKNSGDQSLYDWFCKTNAWTLTKEDFYTQFEFSLLDANLPSDLEWVISNRTLRNIETQFASKFPINGFHTTGITAHLLENGHTIGIHNDYLAGEETHRLIIQLNPGWQESNGGFLMLFNSNQPTDIAKIIKPTNNSVFGFEISSKSFHAVSTVHHYSRYTLVYSFKAL